MTESYIYTIAFQTKDQQPLHQIADANLDLFWETLTKKLGLRDDDIYKDPWYRYQKDHEGWSEYDIILPKRVDQTFLSASVTEALNETDKLHLYNLKIFIRSDRDPQGDDGLN